MAVHDPGKVITDLALSLALGGDCVADIAVLRAEPADHRYLLPDVCLSEGRFLDGLTIADLPRPVDVLPTDGIALRSALGARR